MSSDETIYYASRAAEERTAAADAEGPLAAMHEQLASRYEALARRSVLARTMLDGWHEAE